jgi:type IV fimbrial biogenesis protein FimT
MLMRRHIRARGFTLIELLVTVTVLALVLMLGLPNISAWLQNTQIRNSAEAMIAGLQFARAEALRRNRPVRFNLVDTMDATCSAATSGQNWVVSMADPTSKCDVEASETLDPFILQKRSSQEGSQNAVVASTASGVTFTGLGNVSGGLLSSAAGAMQISVTNPSGGACRTPTGGEPMRCLLVVVSASGSVRMCDPAVTDATDPRRC